MQDPALREMTGTGQRNKARITGNVCLSIQSHPSLPYTQQDSSWMGHRRSWRDEETMLWMRQHHSCHTTLFSPWPFLIPQCYLTLDVLAPKQRTAPPFPSSLVASSKFTSTQNKVGSRGQICWLPWARFCPPSC